MKKVTLGIDIGGTNTVYGFVDIEGVVLAEGSMPTTGYSTVEAYIDNLAKEILSLFDTIKKSADWVGAGIGAPNGNFHKGTVEYAVNLNWSGIVPLAEMLKKHFNVPTYLTNDANAAAIGEMVYGGAKGMRDFIMITLGTGLGSGVVVNGELVYGHDGFAGELGHVIVKCNGRECGCGRKGCLETYASATGIVRTTFELLSLNRDESELRSVAYNNLTSKMIFDAAKKGDPIALKAFDYTAKKLGHALADAIAFSSPEAIFLFGGLAQSGDILLKPTEQYMNQAVLKIFQNKTKLLQSSLDGAKAAVLGASALAWQQINKN